MKRLRWLCGGSLIVIMFALTGLSHAQTSAKRAHPQVPITYPGDTDETIMRRTQWMEGAKKEGTLVWWGTLSPKEASSLIGKFNKIYPFIVVNYWRGKGEEIAAKLESEHAGGRSSVDIAAGGEPTNYPRWRSKGMMEKFTEIIPGIQNMDKRTYGKYGDWAICGQIAITPQYNTKLVSPAEAPKSWDDLLAPKWKGQIGLTTDMKAWTALAIEEGGWGIERTENFLKKLKEQQIIWVPGHPAGHNLLIAGEFKVYGENYIHHIIQSRQKGAPVDWSRVEPIPIVGGSYTLRKGAPHPNAARLFLEWQFSPQGAVAYEAVIGKGSVLPSSGTRMAKMLEGSTFLFSTEEGEMKAVDLSLHERFAKILGIK